MVFKKELNEYILYFHRGGLHDSSFFQGSLSGFAICAEINGNQRLPRLIEEEIHADFTKTQQRGFAKTVSCDAVST